MSAFTIKDIQAILKALRYDDKTTRHKTLIDSGNKNKLTIIGDTIPIDWNQCIPFDGKGKNLPTGALMPPQVSILKLVHSWTVIDVESEEGVRSGLKASDLKPDMAIIGAEISIKALDSIIETFGESEFEFIDVNGARLSAAEWIAQYKTNPFVVLAVMRKNRELVGGGIHF